MDTKPWQAREKIDKRYELIELCGKGNYGEVWKAHDAKLYRNVALKRIYPFLSTRIAIEEARKQGTIRSDYIARVIDISRGNNYIIMEYYPNSLAGQIKKRIKEGSGPLPDNESDQILSGCIRAVRDAHKSGIIHGDVKPANILLDEQLKPYLSDFGVARAIEEEGISLGLGSSTWAAPEVLGGELPDKPSDLFSLGITLYLLFTNRHPFYSNEPSCLLTESDNIKNPRFTVRPLDELRPDLSNRITKTIMDFLSWDRKVRSNAFASAEIQFAEPGKATILESKVTGLMTAEEVSKYLHVTPKTIYRLIKQGRIPATKVSQRWRFDGVSIDQWLRKTPIVSKAKILVVDDDEAIRTVLREIIVREFGCNVMVARTGSEAIEMVTQQDFDLIFLDLKMPDMDGVEVFRRMKTINPKLLVTIITGYPDSELMMRVLLLGPFAVMKKPFDAKDIISAVNTILRVNVRIR
ncbi:MAG: response regulator [Dehalococcoidales bacterium]